VNQFLSEVLPAAGRRVNLKDFAEGIYTDTTTRPLRIGVDVSTWIMRACTGYGNMLGDENHLTNYGRSTIVENARRETTGSLEKRQKEQLVLQYVTTCAKDVVARLQGLHKACQCEILVVLDGATPAIKKDEVRARKKKRQKAEDDRDAAISANVENRLKAFRRAGAGIYFPQVLDAVMEAARENKIAYLVAPYEADGQLAYLLSKQYIDLIVTEDSDLTAYGASPIMYKLVDSTLKEGVAEGVLLRWTDLGALGKYDLQDFSPVMIAVLFVAAGSDYCRKLKGVGIVTASRSVRSAFLDERSTDPLESLFRHLFALSSESIESEEERSDYKLQFIKAVIMFRHPTVYDPVLGRCVIARQNLHDHELRANAMYRRVLDSPEEYKTIVGETAEPDLATKIAEGYVCARSGLNLR